MLTFSGGRIFLVAGATDMRKSFNGLAGIVRERLQAGDSNEQVENYLVQRYGEFVLLKPTFGAHTLLLWLAPALVLVLGGIGAWTALRRRPQATATALDPNEQEAVQALLERDQGR